MRRDFFSEEEYCYAEKLVKASGYVLSKSGKNLAFAITVNNFSGSNSQVITEIEKVLNELANY